MPRLLCTRPLLQPRTHTHAVLRAPAACVGRTRLSSGLRGCYGTRPLPRTALVQAAPPPTPGGRHVRTAGLRLTALPHAPLARTPPLASLHAFSNVRTCASHPDMPLNLPSPLPPPLFPHTPPPPYTGCLALALAHTRAHTRANAPHVRAFYSLATRYRTKAGAAPASPCSPRCLLSFIHPFHSLVLSRSISARRSPSCSCFLFRSRRFFSPPNSGEIVGRNGGKEGED